jgi:hypothetical protein
MEPDNDGSRQLDDQLIATCYDAPIEGRCNSPKLLLADLGFLC